MYFEFSESLQECAFLFLDLRTRVKIAFFRFVKRIPWVKAKIAKESAKTRKALYEDVHKSEPNARFHLRLPASGMGDDEIVRTAEAYNGLGKHA